MSYDVRLNIVNEILSERNRQEFLGFDASHDAAHDAGELALAAATYATPVWAQSVVSTPNCGVHMMIPKSWPWDAAYYRPCGTTRDLVKAAALLIAEIERRRRAGEQ